MAQRASGYDRVPGDLYVTPAWVYEALYTVEPWARFAIDCAPINANGYDFLSDRSLYPQIATNPPFSLADEFVRHALGSGKRVAMLLPYSWDAAKSRRDLFGPDFKARYNITTRIRWENLEQKKAGPSQNHAWFVWDKYYAGTPMIGWL